MQLLTAIPLVLLVLLAAAYFLHLEAVLCITARASARNRAKVQLTRKYGTVLWLMWYVASTGIWGLLAATAMTGCEQTDPEGVLAGQDRYRVMM
jgi:hypothetical protein